MVTWHTLTRSVVILGVVILSVIYALPNLYPNKPIIAMDTAMPAANIASTLSDIPYTQVDDQTLMFDKVEEQMRAHQKLRKSYSQHQFSLNLRSTAPMWLTNIGAFPMKRGLDLQGGVHFLLRVDQSNTAQISQENELSQLENIFMDAGLRFSSLKIEDQSFVLDLISDEDIPNILNLIQEKFGQTAEVVGHVVTWFAGSRDQAHLMAYAVEQTIHSLEKRVNELGISEVQISQQGPDHISIDMPGVQDIAYAKKIIGKTATLSFHLVANDPTFGKSVADKLGNNVPLDSQAILKGDEIIFANARMENLGAVVDIKLNGNAHGFYGATAQNIGRPLAVVYSETKQGEHGAYLDEIVISAPVIRQPLFDQFVISGLESLEQAQELALLLRSGALAAPIEFVEETTIGPSLGEENINNGLMSLAAGLFLVSAFMLFYYGALGLIANIALCLNVIMTVAVLSLLGATLTLPGIAGIVLSIGMAVDANVLINERLREEKSDKKTLRQTLSDGYDKALTAIIDANITTLLVTVVLFYMGSGAIKGFAVTTCIGILVSIFTSVYLTKNMTLFMIELGAIRNFNLKREWFARLPNIRFMEKKHIAFAFSICLLVFSLSALPIKGMNLGLDFTGGSQMVISCPDQIRSEQLRDALKSMSIVNAQVQSYGAENTYMVKVPRHAKITANTVEQIESNIPGARILQSSYIGPQVGAQMLESGGIALCLALVISLIYVAMRFEYRFALSAIVSLIHDPVLIIGIFSWFQLEFNLIALAAMLTILGYSINDTIVVYDRVREKLQTSPDQSTSDTVDNAINQTLARTILTSCLTLTSVVSLFIFGGEYLHSFSIALAIGIVIGTYSSIYIAGSLAVAMGLSREDLLPTPTEVPS